MGTLDISDPEHRQYVDQVREWHRDELDAATSNERRRDYTDLLRRKVLGLRADDVQLGKLAVKLGFKPTDVPKHLDVFRRLIVLEDSAGRVKSESDKMWADLTKYEDETEMIIRNRRETAREMRALAFGGTGTDGSRTHNAEATLREFREQHADLLG
jgi:hypothetical protein